MKFSSRCLISTIVGSVGCAGASFRKTTTWRNSDAGASTGCVTERVGYAADGRRTVTGMPISTRPRTMPLCWATVRFSAVAPTTRDAAIKTPTPRTRIGCILSRTSPRSVRGREPRSKARLLLPLVLDIVLFMISFMAMALLALAAAPQSSPSGGPAPGVSEGLAQERANAISNLRYDLSFTVPADRQQPVTGRGIVQLELKRPHRLVFDFAQPADRLRRVRVGDREIYASVTDGHIVIEEGLTRAGLNRIEFEFTAGDEALNRNDDFLYTLFVPARARLAFPCFDQPNLKARYTLSLRVPTGWQAVSNGSERTRRAEPDASVIEFVETPPLSTYLFAFAAGRFSVETAVRGGRQFRMFHRETDAMKVARNRDAIFDLHAKALAWLEDYTTIRYPWGKFDFVLIPSFQFGGMEHAGAIFYNASGLLLDPSATQNQLLDRASVISHETAHMWFGDLVTMRWFNDVWMKEVFANFMAAKIVNPSFPQVNHELRFLLAYYPQAYQVDRTAGTNPIRQELANLDEAGQLYGPIIYQKAPIVMRQLELMLGADRFRDGLRAYLKRYSYGNATWLDLVRVLDERTPIDVTAWSRAWVEERGRPAFTTDVKIDAHDRLVSIDLTQSDPLGRHLVWPQEMRVALGYPGTVRELPVSVASDLTIVPKG